MSSICSLLWWIPQSRIAGSPGRSVILIWHWKALFHRGCHFVMWPGHSEDPSSSAASGADSVKWYLVDVLLSSLTPWGIHVLLDHPSPGDMSVLISSLFLIWVIFLTFNFKLLSFLMQFQKKDAFCKYFITAYGLFFHCLSFIVFVSVEFVTITSSYGPYFQSHT